MSAALVPNGDGEVSFEEGTYSIGYLHPAIDWIPEGLYRGEPLTPESDRGSWTIHNGPDSQSGRVANNYGPFPIYVHITNGRFFTSKHTRWTKLATD